MVKWAGGCSVHLVHSATGAAAQDGKKAARGGARQQPRQAPRHPRAHRQAPHNERPQPAGADRGQRRYPRGTQPKRGTGRADRRARRPSATHQHPGSGQHTRGGQPKTPAARRDAARRKPTQTANPGAGNATDEQGQAGEEPTPKRPSPPHPQTRRGPPTQPARKLPRRCRYRRNRLSLA